MSEEDLYEGDLEGEYYLQPEEDIYVDDEDLQEDDVFGKDEEEDFVFQDYTDTSHVYDIGIPALSKEEEIWAEVEQISNAYLLAKQDPSYRSPVRKFEPDKQEGFNIDTLLDPNFQFMPPDKHAKAASSTSEKKTDEPSGQYRNIVMQNIMAKMRSSHLGNQVAVKAPSLLERTTDIKKEMISSAIITEPSVVNPKDPEQPLGIKEIKYYVENFDPTEKTVNVMDDVIKNKKENEEIEMSFGVFYREGKFSTFHPGISSTDMSKIEKFISLNPQLFSEGVDSKDRVYSISDIRKIQSDAGTRYEEKERDFIQDIYSLGLRFRLARENGLDPDKDRKKIEQFEFSLKKKGIKKTIRERERKTYVCLGDYEHIKVDISRIKQTNYHIDGKSTTIFKNELEIELMDKVDARIFAQMVQTFVSVLQSPAIEGLDNTIIISKDENEMIVRSHNRLFKKEISEGNWTSRDPFVLYSGFWNKPRNITLMDVLTRNDHTITVKLNGVRNFVYFFNTSVYLLGYPKDVFKIGTHAELQNTLLDGEFIVKDERMQIHVFDILFFKGKDVRMKNFMERLSMMKQVEEMINNSSLTVDYFTKEYFMEGDFYERTKSAYLKESEYEEEETDGLIYQSQGPYYDGNTLKWKQSEYMTIDFMLEDTLIEQGEESIFKLFVHKNILFTGDESHPFNGVMKCKKFLEGESINHKIVECKWKDGTFIPFRIRHDRHQPNNLKTAKGNWKDIQNPIFIQTLLGLDLILMRKFHNQLKLKVLENEFGERLNTIIDIGSGRGGDLKKWKDIGFKKIFAIEPNDENRSELEKRMKKMHIKNVEILPIGAEKTEAIQPVLSHQKIQLNGIVSFFSMTFFPETEKKYQDFLRTIDLIPFGGKFVGMVMDGLTVHRMLMDRNGKLQNDAFRIEDRKRNEGEPMHIGYKIMVDIFESSSMVHNQLEYLFDFEKFMEDMASMHFFPTKGFFLNEEIDHLEYLKKSVSSKENYPRFQNLPFYSKIFSSLNRFFVFEKAYQKITIQKNMFNPESAAVFQKVHMPNVYKTSEDLFYENIYGIGSNFIECILRGLDENNNSTPKQKDEYYRKASLYKEEIAKNIGMDFFLRMHDGEYARRMYMAYVSTGMEMEDAKLKAYEDFKNTILYNINIADYVLLEWVVKEKEISIYILDIKYDLFPSRIFYDICDVVYNYKKSMLLIRTSPEINSFALVYYKQGEKYKSIFDYSKSELIQKIKREICQ
jgi:hypothetical protein